MIGAFLEELASAGEPVWSPHIEEPNGVEAL